MRDSRYKNEVLLIVHSSNHRYLSEEHSDYINFLNNQERLGEERLLQLRSSSYALHLDDVKKFKKHPDDYHDKYINFYNDEFFLDRVLKQRDKYTFELLSGIYSDSFSILNNINNNKLLSGSIEKSIHTDHWLSSYLDKREYTFDELKDKFRPFLKSKGIEWNDRTTIKCVFPSFTKKLKRINGKPVQVYKFDIT